MTINIADVKASVTIEDYLQSRGIRPARDGHTEAAYHCPLGLHDDKTPSFFINKVKQVWHCFGCGEGGDVITLVERLEKLNTGEAIKWLARFAGLADRYPEASTPKPEPRLSQGIKSLPDSDLAKLRVAVEDGAEVHKLAELDHVELAQLIVRELHKHLERETAGRRRRGRVWIR